MSKRKKKNKLLGLMAFLLLVFGALMLVWVFYLRQFQGVAGYFLTPFRTYLLVVQNEAEARPTGGFISAYAVVRTGLGMPSIEVYDSYTLQNHEAEEAPEMVAELLDDGEWYNGHYFRDGNLSPDFRVSAENLQRMYNLNFEEATTFDGILAMNFGMFERVSKALGRDTSRIFYELELETRPSDSHSVEALENRKNPLKEIAKETLRQSLYPNNWGAVTDAVMESLENKDLQLYFRDRKMQRVAEENGWAGRMVQKKSGGDFVHVNVSNYGGKKSDRYVDKAVDLQVKLNEIGEVQNTLNLTLKHREEETALTGDYYGIVKIYVPFGSKLVEGEGWETYEEIGFSVFAKKIEVPVMTILNEKIVYTLPERYLNYYDLEVVRQSGHTQFWTIDLRLPVQKFWRGSGMTLRENHAHWQGVLTEDKAFGLGITPDVIKPSILNQRFEGLTMLWVDTSEVIAPVSLQLNNFVLRDTDRNVPDRTDSLPRVTNIRQEGTKLELRVSGMTRQAREHYELLVKDLLDMSGNKMETQRVTVVQR